MKRISKLLFMVVVIILVFITGKSFAGTVWIDDFESYQTGTFPSSLWVNSGSTDAYVDETEKISGNKSFKLFGLVGSCWGALAHRELGVQPPYTIHFYVYNGSESLSGCHSLYGHVHLNTGPSWTYPVRGLIFFDVDNRTGEKIIRGASNNNDPVDGVNLGTFTSDTWYEVQIKYEIIDAATVRLSYWINGSFKGSYDYASLPYENDLSFISIQSAEGSAWFDDVTITKMSDSWTVKADMPTARAALAAVAVNGKIYAIGGGWDWFIGSYLNKTEEYTPATNTWTVKADMPTARGYLAAVAVNGKIYAIGGWNGSGALKTTEEYDPATNTWSAKVDMPTARAGLAAVAVNGKIYAIGGTNYCGGALKTTEEYDPATNTWSAKADMPAAGEGLAAVAVNGKIYAIGGSDGVGGALKTTEEYTPATNTWSAKADMPTARGGIAAAAVNNKIYAIGGSNFSDYQPLMNGTEEYDPATNTWTVKADMPTSRCFLAAVDVNGKIYAIGGGDANVEPLQGNEEFRGDACDYVALLVKDSALLDVDEVYFRDFLDTNGFGYDIVDASMIKNETVSLSNYNVFYMITGSEPTAYNDPDVISKIRTRVENGAKLVLESYGFFLGQYLGLGTTDLYIYNPCVHDAVYFVEPITPDYLFTNINSWSPPVLPDKSDQLIVQITPGLYYGPKFIANVPFQTIQFWFLVATYGWYGQPTDSSYCLQHNNLCAPDRSVYHSDNAGEGSGIKLIDLGNGRIYLINIASGVPASNVSFGPVANQIRINMITAPINLTPDISINPTSHDFGSVNVGTSSAPQTFTISNTGAADLTVSSIDLSDITNYTIDKTGCGILPATITPSNNCIVTVTFSPSSTGTKNANLTIVSDDPDTPTLNVPLSGTGQMQICFSNSDCNFERYCKKPEGDCSGSGVCAVKPEICLDIYFPVCGCDGVTYSNECVAAGSGVSVAYQGECVVPLPDISVSPTSIDFGDVVVGSSSASQTVTISNTGGTNLTIGEIKIIGTDAFTIPADGCSNQTVSSCTLLVRFSPTSLGAKNAILRIPSNDPDENPLDVPLSGNGVVLSTEITLIVPNGGEVLPSGGTYAICWKAPNNAVKFDLKYTTGGTNWIPIKTVTGLNCTHWEEVPVVKVNKKKCRVKVIGYDSNSVKVGEDISDKPFTIVVLMVQSPNGGETLTSGSTWGIRWLTNKTIRPVVKTVLKYTTDGTTWKAIKTLSGNPGNYLWKVPFVSSTKCKVKVILKDSSGVNVGTDASDKVFTIKP